MHAKKAAAERRKQETGGGNGDFPKPLQCRNWPLSPNGNRGGGNHSRSGEGGATDGTYSTLEVEEGDRGTPYRSGGEEGNNAGREGDARAPPPPAGPLIPRRHLKQYLIGTLVMSAVVLASVALVISLRRPGHPTVVIHVTNSSGMDDVAVPLNDDAQKATDDVINGRLGTRLWLKDSTERVQKRSELQEFVTTPGFSPQVSLGPQTSPADDLLTKSMTSLPHPPSPPPVVIGPVGTTLGGSGNPQPLTMSMVIDPPKTSPQIDPKPQQSTTPPTRFEQHAPDTTPQPNNHNQTPFKSQTPLHYMYDFKPIPPMTPALPPTCTTTAAPSTAMSTAELLNITCQDKKELCAGTGTFSSPEYPEEYPKYQCITWRITTDPGNCITIAFQNFSVERNLQCKFDKVWVVTNGKTVYGPMCGTDRPRPQKGREVELTFLSDGSMGMTGFKVRYSSQAGDGPDCG